MWCVVVGTYNFRYVRKVIGLFETEQAAKKYASNKNFGPNGWKVFPIERIENYDHCGK